MLSSLQKKFLVILAIALSSAVVLSGAVYLILPSVVTQTVTAREIQSVAPTATTTAGPVDPSTVHGIDSGPPSEYPGITWTRISYKTCGGKLATDTLKNAVQLNHTQGVRVLLLLCQQPGKNLLSKVAVDDIAAAHADAIACGNEQMKHNTYPTYVAPADYARFFDLCEKTVHAVSPGIPVLMGSLDPHVGGSDTPALLTQVQFLNAMETAMNTVVHPKGTWKWRSQAIGLIDSWHNGYPTPAVNSLQALFTFWAQQFHVDLAKGQLGPHLWVVEGTGCIYNCGLNPYLPSQIAVAHILTLITDVQASVRYHIPFFYFSGKDFSQRAGKSSTFWPMGVLDKKGKAKPLRQDLATGSRTLKLSCSTGPVSVTEQEPFLVKLYAGCTLPSNYVALLTK